MAPKRGQATKKDREFLSSASKGLRLRKIKDDRWATFPQMFLFYLAKLKANGKRLANIDVDAALSPDQGQTSCDLEDEIMEAADSVPDSTWTANESNKPLLDDCALDMDPSPHLAWDLVKRDLLNLHPCDLREPMARLEQHGCTGDDALASLFADEGVLAWLKDAGAKIFECVRVDDRLAYEMNDSLSKVDPDSDDDYMEGVYENAAERRKKNLVKLNELTACVTTYMFLCSSLATFENPWPGFEAVREFFAERGLDHEKLERFCEVMDVEVRTNRYLVKEKPEDDGNCTTTVKVDVDLCPSEEVRDLVELPRDLTFLQWVNNVMRTIDAKQGSEWKNLTSSVKEWYRDNLETRIFY